MSRDTDQNSLYSMLDDLRRSVGGYRYLRTARRSDGWPERGVYFFFEKTAAARRPAGLRLVRIGTHALKTGARSTLWSRLNQHQGTRAGRHPGGGHHRGSVFRKHVGRALLRRDEYPEVIRTSWGIGSTADRATRDAEHPLEHAVSSYIGDLPFLWVDVGDTPGPASDRGTIERNAIGLLSESGQARNVDSSRAWLGALADRDAIRDSGLWNVNHVYDGYDRSFLDVLSGCIASMSA